MRRIGIILCVLALVVSGTAQAQDLKPARDRQTKKYGYQAKDKSWVIEPVYDAAKRFIDGFAIVELNGHEGLIDIDGDMILQPEYDKIGKFDQNGICELMRKEGKTKWYGAADQTGAIIVPVECTDIKIPKKGGYITAERVATVEGFDTSTLWGIYDLQGKEIFSPQFLASPSFSSGTFIVKSARTGLTGVVDMDGRELLPCKYLAVDHHGGGYYALTPEFNRFRFSGSLIQEEAYHVKGAVAPYDPMGDPIRAAAWHSGCIGIRMHRNNIKLYGNRDGSSLGYCDELPLDWGRGRFLRLEPFEDPERHEGAMPDPATGKYYTLKALMYEADGTRPQVVSDWGWLEGECGAGAIYRTDSGKRWMLLEDLNCPDVPAFNVSVSGYKAISHDNVYNGLGIRAADVERLADPHRFADRLKQICDGDNVGLDSYVARSTDLRHARQARELMRAPFFRYPYMIGEVVNCSVSKRGEDAEVTLYEQLVCHFSDQLEYPSYSKSGDELIYWGPHNGRTVRMSLEAGSSDCLVDDITGSNTKYMIVLSLYEEDGSWLRTLAELPYADYLDDGVMVFERAGIAVLTPKASRYRHDDYGRSGYGRDSRGRIQRTVRIPLAKKLPHTLSALNEAAMGPSDQGFSGRRQWND